MRLFHICTRRIYEEKGEKKIQWYKAGALKEADNGKMYLRLFHLPDVAFFVFEKEQAKEEIQKEENKIIS
jgi:hypothetical protein